MASTSIPLFLSLPFELREQIYKWATPTRVVHVQKDAESYEDFLERQKRTWPLLKLDPTLTHFALNWRKYIPFGNRHLPLEAFGFSGLASIQPWAPSSSTPEIPLHWLGEHPEIAWELARKVKLYSNAQIPRLLHTWSESRAVLIHWGYQVAFRTRSHGPCTWFHFDRDVLFLQIHHPEDDSDRDYSSILTGAHWYFGQFHPQDLQSVQTVALGAGGQFLDSTRIWGEWSWEDDVNLDISAMVRLFGCLEELYLVEWTRKDLEQWPNVCSGNVRPEVLWPEPWTCVPAMEVDAILSLFSHESCWRGHLTGAGKYGERQRAHKVQNGLDARLMADLQLELMHRLTRLRDSELLMNRGEPFDSWKVPKITMMHVLPESQLTPLWRQRSKVLSKIRRLKSERAEDMRNPGSRARITLKLRSDKTWVDEESLEATPEEEEAMLALVDEVEALAELQRDEDALAKLQQKFFSKSWPVEEAAFHLLDDDLAYIETHYSPDSARYDWGHCTSNYCERDHLLIEREWWVREGWFLAFDDKECSSLNC